ncbi:hypothetical protein RISK_006418 [Rhodopirellula islandica]|uniref:Uncharacterized protein n=1 Tax=Rhodopirellula islandica TaxID=595434 RepID=A0A0J1B510_RHOIS|nr:hypothetical protein RISK_006418 [Rhodopirellula islandica]
MKRVTPVMSGDQLYWREKVLTLLTIWPGNRIDRLVTTARKVLSRSDGMIGHNDVSRLGVRPGCE